MKGRHVRKRPYALGGPGSARRLVPVLVLVIALATLGIPGFAAAVSPATPAPTEPARTVTVTGTVMDEAGVAGIAGVDVVVYSDWNDPDVTEYRTVSGPDGTYSIMVPQGAGFDVLFDPTARNLANGTHYLAQWADGWGGSSDYPGYPAVGAQPAGTVVSATDGFLPVGATITGTVTGEGKPLGDCMVEVRSSAYGLYTTVFTETDGSYSVTLRVPAAGDPDYLIRFDPGTPSPFLPRWFDGVAAEESATPVAVTLDGTTPGIDADLPRGGSIAGTVRAPGGSAAASVAVAAIGPAGVRFGYTDAAGSYLFQGLEEGPYFALISPDALWSTDTSSFNELNGTAYTVQVWDDRPMSSPDTVAVTLGVDRVGVDATLHPGAAISGTIRDASGTPIAGMDVSASGSAFHDPWSTAVTAADGTYQIGRRPYDTYTVYVDPAEFNRVHRTGYVPNAYPDPVELSTVTTATSVDITLAVGAVVMGRVTGPTGSGVPSVTITAYDGKGENMLVRTESAADGSYELRGITVPNRVKIEYSTDEYNSATGADLVSQWWSGKPDWFSADVIVLDTVKTIAGADVRLLKGGRVSGTIYDGKVAGPDNGLGDAEVELRTPDGRTVGYEYTDGTGGYTFRAVPAGAYKVAASYYGPKKNYPTRWYANAGTLAGAKSFALAVGQVVSGKDIVLLPGGSLSGTVTDKVSGLPVAGVDVRVLDTDGMEVALTSTDSLGKWESGDHEEGTYYVQFDPTYRNGLHGSTYAAQWYDGAAPSNAKPVAVTLDAKVAGIDAKLDPAAATITGRLLERGGAAAKSKGGFITVDVHQFFAGRWTPVGSAETRADGTFAIGSLSAGTYRLTAAEDNGYIATYESIVSQALYHSDSVDTTSVGWVDVASDIVVPAAGLDIGDWTVLRGGKIGVQVNDATGTGIPYVRIYADTRLPDGTWVPYGGDGLIGETWDDGGALAYRDYEGGLLPGLLRVRLAKDGYAPLYYDGASTAASATALAVPQYLPAHDYPQITQVMQSMTFAPDRQAGADRYAVAAGLAARAPGGYTGVRHVIIASGLDRAAADPLSAAGLAGAYKAPVLLVRGDKTNYLPAATAAALREIRAANPGARIAVHVVGGPVSVPEKVVGQVKAVLGAGTTSDRLSGADRYAVAANVAARMRAVYGPSYPRGVFIVNGSSPGLFFNALAASPVCYGKGYPLLLVKGPAVPPATAAALRNYTDKWVVGNEVAVPESVRLAQVARRVGGANRNEVAANFATTAYEQGWADISTVGVANALADSLTGGASIGSLGGVMLYTGNATSLSPATTQFLINWKGTVDTVLVLGGPISVNPALSTEIQNILK